MNQIYIKTWTKLLAIIIFAKLCVSQELDDTIVGKENIRALVAVFHTPSKLPLTNDIVYEYQCPGALIHTKGVLVLSYCWSQPSQTLDTVVRSYDWLSYKIIDDQVSYQERSVTEILNFVSYDSAQSIASHLNIVVLSRPFELEPTISIIPQMSYLSRREPTRSECFSVHIAGNVTSGLSLNIFSIWPTDLVSCCTNWQPSLFEADDVAKELNKCIKKLQGLSCYEYVHSASCNHLNAMGAPVFCQKSEARGEYFLRGFLADRKKCKFAITHIGEQKWWIRDEISALDSNPHTMDRLYKLISS